VGEQGEILIEVVLWIHLVSGLQVQPVQCSVLDPYNASLALTCCHHFLHLDPIHHHMSVGSHPSYVRWVSKDGGPIAFKDISTTQARYHEPWNTAGGVCGMPTFDASSGWDPMTGLGSLSYPAMRDAALKLP
jgi:hypothetical protein